MPRSRRTQISLELSLKSLPITIVVTALSGEPFIIEKSGW
ncbi:hypothetical protein SHEWT2_03018 [Shewanella hafniensis]|nr:hypothetical protein SHEWT2_03018 [Shewanella hafniensis]